MKNILPRDLFNYLALLLAFPAIGFGQDCAPATAQTQLNANAIHATLLNGGDMWWDRADGKYLTPPNNGDGDPSVAGIFAGGLWLGGFDPGGTLKLAAQTYGSSNGSVDFWPGPLDDTGMTNSDVCSDYDRFWETSKEDIEMHLSDFSDNGVIDGPIPESVRAWPAQGNPFFMDIHGFSLPIGQRMAPFFDQDNDGLYDPQQGDVPYINEADQGIWWVFNDAGNIHTESQGNAIRMEVQVLAYAYADLTDIIDNTTFYDYTIINRGVESIDSAYAALWVDPDLGCYTDDYIGCNPDQDFAFVYNADAIDGDDNCNCQFGISTYCEEIPIVGVKMLKGAWSGKVFGPNGELLNPPLGQVADTIVDAGMSSFMTYNNGGINPPPPPGTTDPSIALEYYNLMSGSWRDGTRLTEGGDGYNPASTQFTNYIYPDSPADPNGWSMCSANISSGDTRMVIGSGPFRLDPGAVNTMSFAVVHIPDVPHPCPDFSDFAGLVNDVQNFYDTEIITATEEIAQEKSTIQLLPNPMFEQAELIFPDLNNQVEYINIYTIDGRLIKSYQAVEGNSLTIQRENWNAGMYVYKLVTEDFKVYSGKFVVQE